MDYVFWVIVWIIMVFLIIAVFHGGNRESPCDRCPPEKWCGDCEVFKEMMSR